MAKSTQEILDELVISFSPLTNRIYVGLLDKKHPNTLRVKSDFTDRFYEFAPFLQEQQKKD